MKKQKLLNLKKFKIAYLNQNSILGKGDGDEDRDDDDGDGGNTAMKSKLVMCIGKTQDILCKSLEPLACI